MERIYRENVYKIEKYVILNVSLSLSFFQAHACPCVVIIWVAEYRGAKNRDVTYPSPSRRKLQLVVR